METVLAAAVVTRSNFTSTALPGWGGGAAAKRGCCQQADGRHEPGRFGVHPIRFGQARPCSASRLKKETPAEIRTSCENQ